MTSFFNQKNPCAAVMRVYNSVVLVCAAYDYYTNPDSSWDEQGFAMAVSVLNIVSLRPNTGIIVGMGSLALNFTALGAVLRGYTSEWSSVSPAINLIAAAGHIASGVVAADASASDSGKSASLKRS